MYWVTSVYLVTSVSDKLMFPIVRSIYLLFRPLQSLKESKQGKVQRSWTDDELLHSMQLILDGYTYLDVTDGKTVPMSTLWTRFNLLQF